MNFETNAKAAQGMIPSLPAHSLAKEMGPESLAMMKRKISKKPWSASNGPGRLDDYFNYGFDEHTWKMYVHRQNIALSQNYPA